MVLHTWNQRLDHHAHVHAVVPAGVLSPDGRWRDTGTDFLLDVKDLSDEFRRRFLKGLRRLHAKGKLNFDDHLPDLADLADLADPEKFEALLARACKHAWVVNAQAPPYGCEDPDQALKYAAGYVAGAAISDDQLISHDGEKVTFWVKQREAQAITRRTRTRPRRYPVDMEGFEFTCRFMMHVLPKNFQRVRYRGLYHHSKRDTYERSRYFVGV
jgi:hypothetical protein